MYVRMYYFENVFHLFSSDIRYSFSQSLPPGCPECICCLSVATPAKILIHYEHFSIDRRRRLYRAITNLCCICLEVLTRPSHTMIRIKVALVQISYWHYLTQLTTINVRSLEVACGVQIVGNLRCLGRCVGNANITLNK